MAIRFCTLSLLTFLISSNVNAQMETFISSAGEMNFSLADIEREDGPVGDNVLRFAPFFNLQVLYNGDLKNFGWFTGLTIRNVGFIYEENQTNEKWKARTYNLGIPLGLKLGDVKNGFFVYGGYEFEYAFHYKEKYFFNDKKTKFNAWNSNRVNNLQQAYYFGFNFPNGANIKFKYYTTEFFNPDYNTSQSEASELNTRNLKVNIFYASLSFYLFSKPKEFFDPEESNEIY